MSVSFYKNVWPSRGAMGPMGPHLIITTSHHQLKAKQKVGVQWHLGSKGSGGSYNSFVSNAWAHGNPGVARGYPAGEPIGSQGRPMRPRALEARGPLDPLARQVKGPSDLVALGPCIEFSLSPCAWARPTKYSMCFIFKFISCQ